MKLYHGSNVEIDVIDLKKGRRGKDFGQGFYLSDDLQQARDMANTVVDREECGKPIVTVFEFDESLLTTDAIDFKKFEHYSTEWGRFVRSNRKNRTSEQLHSHDIVYGPIADDTIAKQMRRIDLNIIDEERFMQEIQYARETFQYFFGTEKAISCLTKTGTI